MSETVSLRDLPATIVDLAGQGSRAPFPGRSLARLWQDSRPWTLSPTAKARSRNWQVPIPMIRIKGGRPSIAAHWFHSPKAITFTFAMKVTAAKSSSTGATIRTNIDNRARVRGRTSRQGTASDASRPDESGPRNDAEPSFTVIDELSPSRETSDRRTHPVRAIRLNQGRGYARQASPSFRTWQLHASMPVRCNELIPKLIMLLGHGTVQS